MTNKEIYIKSLNEDLKHLNEKIETTKSKIKTAENLIDLPISDLKFELYKALCNGSELINVKIVNKKYERILGGDGRSQPWSDSVEGNVCIIESKCFLGDNYSRNGFKEFAKKTLKANNVEEVEFKHI
jgi:hypothetical protein